MERISFRLRTYEAKHSIPMQGELPTHNKLVR